MDRETIYRSSNLHAFILDFASQSTELVVVSFQNRVEKPSLDGMGFGETFFAKSRTSAVFVNCSSNAWWQYKDLLQCLDAVKGRTSSFAHRAAYGSSMGGYAATRFADILGCTVSVAACPQYSPRSSVIKSETRYEKDIEGIEFLHENEFVSLYDIPRYILFDPYLAVDNDQARRYRDNGNVMLVKLPGSGHPCLALLSAQGVLSEVLRDMFAGNFDYQHFALQSHQRRRLAYRYHEQLSYRFAERGKLRTASLIAEWAAKEFPEKADEVLSLALRWSLYRGDFIRAGWLTSKITANLPEAARLWDITCKNHSRR